MIARRLAALACAIAFSSVARADRSPLVDARPYFAHVPPSSVPRPFRAPPRPLLVLLHGYGDTGENFARAVLRITDELGWIVVAPDGTPDARGHRFWNAAAACCDFDGRRPDDVAYVTALVADARARFSVDEKRIYALGYSNGGFLVHRLACERAGLFAALVSIGGAADPDAACRPAKPTALLEIHGVRDEVVLPTGGALGAGLPTRGRYLSDRESVARFARAIGCRGAPKEIVRAASLRNITVRAARYVEHPCPRGAAELAEFPNDGHALATDEIAHGISFLLAAPTR